MDALIIREETCHSVFSLTRLVLGIGVLSDSSDVIVLSDLSSAGILLDRRFLIFLLLRFRREKSLERRLRILSFHSSSLVTRFLSVNLRDLMSLSTFLSSEISDSLGSFKE